MGILNKLNSCRSKTQLLRNHLLIRNTFHIADVQFHTAESIHFQRLSINICTLNLINASSNFDQIQLSMKFSFHYLFSSVCQFPRKAMFLWPNLIMTPIIERRAAQLCHNKSSNALLIIEYFPLQLSEETFFVHCAFSISESTRVVFDRRQQYRWHKMHYHLNGNISTNFIQ